MLADWQKRMHLTRVSFCPSLVIFAGWPRQLSIPVYRRVAARFDLASKLMLNPLYIFPKNDAHVIWVLNCLMILASAFERNRARIMYGWWVIDTTPGGRDGVKFISSAKIHLDVKKYTSQKSPENTRILARFSAYSRSIVFFERDREYDTPRIHPGRRLTERL